MAFERIWRSLPELWVRTRMWSTHCREPRAPLEAWAELIRDQLLTVSSPFSGIFGYVNYLVEKDRKFIVDTLINGMWPSSIPPPIPTPSQLAARGGVALVGWAGM